MSRFRPLKYITNVTGSEVTTQIMKIAQIIYKYHIKPDKTLDIYIVKLHLGTVLKAHFSHRFSHGFLNIFLEPGTGCGWGGSSRYGSKEQ